MTLSPARLLGITCGAYLTTILWSATTRSAEPLARLELTPAQVTVGSPARLRVTVLVPTRFSAPPEYPSFQLPELLVRLPPGASGDTTEIIGGQAYSGLVRDYQLYPRQAGNFVLAGMEIGTAHADAETGQPVATRLPLEAIELRGTIPGGGEVLDPFLPSTRLRISQQISGADGDLEQGATVTRSLRVTAIGLPAAFLPQLLGQSAPPGLRPYPAVARTSDLPAPGGHSSTGRRDEAVTYVVQEPGRYELPALALRWWNTESQSVHTATVPSVSFSVPAAPGNDEATLAGTRHGRDRFSPLTRVASAIAGALLSLMFVLALWPRPRRALIAKWYAHRQQRRNSEAGRFAALAKAIESAPTGELRMYVSAWLEPASGSPLQLSDLATQLPREIQATAELQMLSYCIETLDRALFSSTPSTFGPQERRALARAVRSARPVLREFRIRPAPRPGLLPLNP